jgi:hypothetical protein
MNTINRIRLATPRVRESSSNSTKVMAV